MNIEFSNCGTRKTTMERAIYEMHTKKNLTFSEGIATGLC